MKEDMEHLLIRLRAFRDQRGWKRFHNPKDLAISVSIEAAELLEIFQWTAGNIHADSKTRSRVADEAADVMIYILMLLDSMGIDPLKAAFSKIESNEKRFPPSLVYGKAKSSND